MFHSTISFKIVFKLAQQHVKRKKNADGIE